MHGPAWVLMAVTASVPSQPSARAPQGLCSLEDVDDYDLADATGEGDYQPLGRNGLPVQAPAQLTAEQRDRIEMNRQLALERAQARQAAAGAAPIGQQGGNANADEMEAAWADSMMAGIAGDEDMEDAFAQAEADAMGAFDDEDVDEAEDLVGAPPAAAPAANEPPEPEVSDSEPSDSEPESDPDDDEEQADAGADATQRLGSGDDGDEATQVQGGAGEPLAGDGSALRELPAQAAAQARAQALAEAAALEAGSDSD
jgi:hypothetical protein